MLTPEGSDPALAGAGSEPDTIRSVENRQQFKALLLARSYRACFAQGDDNGVVQILYAPLREDGLPDPQISDKIVGVTVEDMRTIARDPKKRVILVAGGSGKINALQRVIRFPCYNVLVTDVGVAAEAIRRQATD